MKIEKNFIQLLKQQIVKFLKIIKVISSSTLVISLDGPLQEYSNPIVIISLLN